VRKQGRFLPGVHVPIDRPEPLHDEMPDYVLLLAWTFREEVMVQQAEYVPGAAGSSSRCPNLASADWRWFSPVEPFDEIVLLQRGRCLTQGVEGQPRPPGDVEE
jgi:C-methyltransferase C-terminal domain